MIFQRLFIIVFFVSNQNFIMSTVYPSIRCYNSYQLAESNKPDFYTVSFRKNSEFTLIDKDADIEIFTYTICNIKDSNNSDLVKTLWDVTLTDELKDIKEYIPKLSGEIILKGDPQIYVAWSYQSELTCPVSSTNALVYFKLFLCIEEAIKFYKDVIPKLESTVYSKVIVKLDGSIFIDTTVNPNLIFVEGNIYNVITENTNCYSIIKIGYEKF